MVDDVCRWALRGGAGSARTFPNSPQRAEINQQGRARPQNNRGAPFLPADQVGAGIALTNLAFQTAMLIGPAIAGVVVAQWGVAACYLLDELTFAAALYGVLRLPAMRPQGETARPGARAIWEVWRFIIGKPLLHKALLSDVLATVTAMPMALFPLINSERFAAGVRKPWACSSPRSPSAGSRRVPPPAAAPADRAWSCWPRQERGAWHWPESVWRSRYGWR